MSKKKIYISTQNKFEGYKRQLAWFSRHESDLYFDVAGFFQGSHTSYHKDGNIFRTNTGLSPKAVFVDRKVPLSDFNSWHQFGTTMLLKETVPGLPIIEERHHKKATKIEEINLDCFPSETINIVVEIIDPKLISYINYEHLAPPSEGNTIKIKDIQPFIILTMLGHESNLLIKPNQTGFTVSHFNSRFSANRKDVKYRYDALVSR